MGCQAQKQDVPEEPIPGPEEPKPTPPPLIEVTAEMKANFLEVAGFAGGMVVETPHPYEAEPTNWKQKVKIPDAAALAVYFAPRSCTYDNGTCVRIFAGGQDRATAGAGARMEFEVKGGGKMRCTIVEFDAASGLRKVLLDRSGQEVVQWDGAQPIKVGDTVEAQRNGEWYPARVEEVQETREWYSAKRKPAQCFVSWFDGEDQDDFKKVSELRPPHATPQVDGRSLEDLPRAGPRYGYLLDNERECFAIVHDEPRACWVDYAGSTVGEEITEFELDTSHPLTPIRVKAFGADAGPAQDSGVQVGWFLDLLGMESADAGCWTGLLQVLDGIGGLSLPELNDESEPVPAGHISKLLDAALNNPKDLLQRLNEALTTKEAKLLFTNSASSQPGVLLGEARIRYPKGVKVGAEIKTFTKGPRGVKVLEFLGDGPAQVAGVMTDWTLDVKQTVSGCKQADAKITQQLLLDNPNRLLSLYDVTLVFKMKKGGISQVFEASGPPDAKGPSSLQCLKPQGMPDTTDVWLTAGAEALKQTSGKYYHEVRLDEASATPQLGWLADSFTPGAFDNRGIGDDEHGWAVDGVRCLNWHRGSTPASWPRDWQQGDVIGFGLDLDGGKMKCSLNGQWVEATSTTFSPNGRALYPAVSLKGLFTLNITEASWAFRPPDDSYTAWSAEGNYQRPNAQRWSCPELPVNSADFEFCSDGGGKDMPQKRWGVWALVLPRDSKAPTEEELNTLVAKWTGEQE